MLIKGLINSEEEWFYGEYNISKQKNGEFREYDDEGAYYFGSYVNGQKQNVWTEVKKNGDELERKYLDN